MNDDDDNAVAAAYQEAEAILAEETASAYTRGRIDGAIGASLCILVTVVLLTALWWTGGG